MARPNLLLCFDAFGTLFRPKRSVFLQYNEVARQCGILGLKDDEITLSMKQAIRDEAKLHPNYGKATGLGATRWWTNVIHKTFTPLLNGKDLPKDLAPKLLHRFSSKEGYDVEQNLPSTLKALKREIAENRFNKVTVGVITNSDDRVPSVLSSFGLQVSPLRYGTVVTPSLLQQDYDIDFHCISYDVGVEKPDSMIFHAAELMLAHIITARDGRSTAEALLEIATWQKIYVGDEYGKDVVGARNAGWSPVLLQGDGQAEGITSPDSSSVGQLDGLFEEDAIVGVNSIKDLVEWLQSGSPMIEQEAATAK